MRDHDVIESETYHSALELGAQALRVMGLHPFFAEQQKVAFKNIEDEQSGLLYEAWADDESGERFDNKFRQLFMRLEEKIAEAMGLERRGKHSLAEREWTPPPKDYLDDFKDD